MKLRDRQKRGNIAFTGRGRGMKHGSRWRRRDFIFYLAGRMPEIVMGDL